ncbi:MAG: hypothetical protein CMN30_28785 [Sandaracinus sp.]|nr:hypothetical protein [Sandaracinus sp.]
MTVGLPEYTSASQLKTYAMCPRKYALRYLDDAEPEDKGPSLVVGSVVHSAIGWFFETRLAEREPTIDEALDVVHADFAAAIDGPPVRWGRWTQADLLEHTGNLVRFFLEEEGDLVVADVEERHQVELHHPVTGEALPRPLLCYLDFRVDGDDVVELKTSRSPYSEASIGSNLQFGAYAAVLDELGAGSLAVWVVIKNKRPRLQKLKVQRNPLRERWFFDAAMAIEEAIAAGHFPPAPGWTCATCEYRRRCLGTVQADARAA